MSTEDILRTHEGNNRLAAIHERLEDTSAEIAGTIAHLERLRGRKRDILVELNALVSPILELPPELVCEIFLRCLPPPHAGVLPSSLTAPLLLTHVCSQWRVIALSLPQLWTSLSVAAVLAANPKPGLLALIDLWVARAGSCLLSISILLENEDYPILWQEMTRGIACGPVLHKLRHSSHRWRELEIVRRVDDFPALLHRDDPWHLPELTKLTLLFVHNGRHHHAFGFPPNLLSNLTDLPSLREVHLMGFAPPNLLLPWAQLTTLVHAAFALWSTGQRFHVPSHLTPPRLMHLASLELFGELCTALLEPIDAPALANFRITFGPGNDVAQLATFLARCSRLRDFSLDARCAVPPSELAACLEAIPHIRSLQLGLHTGVMNGPLPHALRRNPALLPALKRLVVSERVDRYNEPPLDEAVIVAMLRARWRGASTKSPSATNSASAESADTAGPRRPGTLTFFSLITSHAFDPAQLNPGFAALAREGMHIDLRSPGTGPFLVVYYDSDMRA
ncbi:hypothetical protein C8R43DRAFT_1232897 [Mycena crocata]|nr:hypothetical protein C8R43DRAFT_1232897 [Mycena crocata]